MLTTFPEPNYIYTGSKPLTTTTMSLPKGPFNQAKALALSRAIDGTILAAIHSNNPLTPELEFGVSGTFAKMAPCLITKHGLTLGQLVNQLQKGDIRLSEIDEIVELFWG